MTPPILDLCRSGGNPVGPQMVCPLASLRAYQTWFRARDGDSGPSSAHPIRARRTPAAPAAAMPAKTLRRCRCHAGQKITATWVHPHRSRPPALEVRPASQI
jgi:hypothetical protein